jgi:hypothetical protein
LALIDLGAGAGAPARLLAGTPFGHDRAIDATNNRKQVIPRGALMPDWLSRNLPEGWSQTQRVIAWLAITVTTALLSLAAVALVVVRIPCNYFVGDDPPPVWADRHAFIRWPAIILKNLLGGFLVLLGAVLSVPGVPGQGLLTILIGAMLIDFPGKRRIEKWLLRRRGVLNTINKLRARYGREPLVLDAPSAAT